MAKQPQHGGKREGSGRKPIPVAERRSEIFSVRVTREEKTLLDAADANAWARDILIQSAKKRRK